MSHSCDEKSIFLDAIELPVSERPTFLDRVCRDDPRLRADVQRLIDEHERTGFLVDRADPAAAQAGGPTMAEGATLGPYKLLQQIGEGGFGVVYMARQDKPLQRVVALKVVKPGMDTRDVIARFEAERQALALMDHPNIARVLDAGATEGGRPYFVMELVKGVPITDFLDQNNLPTRDRLQLFLDVCHAVQHAHQKGIIHRDLKPSNVMITLHDGRPVPKVIDFGVSKAIGQQLTERTLFTRYGQMVGTPQYMSPEQAEMSGLDVDTRSDIYSLGVLLYELLTGTTPLEAERLRTAGYAEMLRMIQHEDPPRPSARLSTLGDNLTVICRHRSTDPRGLGQLIRGDLDWIVMKALEKDRGRRYETVTNLAYDIERHLRNEPVSAGPPGSLYRLRKFVRRNRSLVMTGLTILMALVAGLSLATVGFVQARNERDRARSAERDATSARADAEQQRDAAERTRAAETAQRERTEKNLYFHQVNLAHREWLNNHPLRADQLLDECKPELRGWEWRYVRGLADARIATFEGHAPHPRRLAFSPDGRLLASCSGLFGQSDPGEVIIWDVAARASRFTFPVDPGPVTGVCFSPDNRLIAACTTDFETSTRGRILVWDAVSGEQTHNLGAGDPAGNFFSIDFSPAGQLLASAGSDGVIRLWSLDTGAETRSFSGHRGNAFGVAFSPDGRRLASAGRDGTARVWDVDSGQPLHVLRGSPDFRWVEFMPDGDLLVAGGYPSDDGILIVWDVSREARELARYHLAGSAVGSFSLSADGRYVALPAGDGSVHVRETLTGAPVRVLRAHSGGVSAVAFSPDGRTLASAGLDLTVRLWDLAEPEIPRQFDGHSTFIDEISFSPDGNLLAMAGGLYVSRRGVGEKTARIWDFRQQRVTHVLAGHTGWLTTVAFSPDGKRVVSGSDDRTVRIWDLESQTIVHTLEAHSDVVTSVACSPDGSLLASASGDRTIRLWDARTGQELAILAGHTDRVESVRFDRTGQWLASASADQTARIWDVATRREQAVLRGHTDRLTEVAFSPDGRFVATAAMDHAVILWEISASAAGDWSVSPHHWLRAHGEPVIGIAFSPDGRRLASVGRRVSTKIWDVATGQESISFPTGIYGNYWLDVAYSPDGQRLAASFGGRVQVWEADDGSPENRARQRAEAAKAWYDDQARYCEQSRNWAGAVQHLNRLISEHPRRAGYFSRRGHAHSQLADAGAPDRPNHRQLAGKDYEMAVRLRGNGHRGLLLTGWGEHVVGPHVPFDQYDAFTIEAWIDGDWRRTLLCQGQQGDPESSLWLAPSALASGPRETFGYGWERHGHGHARGFEQALPHKWNHVALVYDGSERRLFVNGALMSSHPAPGPGPLDRRRQLLLGAYETAQGRLPAASGLLRSIRISQRALYEVDFTPAESFEVHDDTVLLYDFAADRDWMTTGQVRDRSSYGHHGTLQRAWWIHR